MLLKSGGRESAPRTRWRIIHVGFFRSSGIVHPFRRGAEHHPQLFNLLIFNDFSVNPTDGHQGSDASTVIGRPISAGEEAGRGPSAGVGLPGGWRQQTHMSGPPGSRDECTANGIARRKHGLRLHRRAWICPGPAPEATDSHAASVGDCKGPAADRSVRREQGSPPPPSSASVDARPGRTPGAADLQTGQSAIATDVRPTRSRVASKGFAFSRKSAMYSRGSGAACGSSTLSGSRWTPRTRNS